MENYRFAITDDGTIVAFGRELQKEVYHKYLEANGLTEENVMDAGQDWEAIQEGLSEEDLAKEQPNLLPEKYSGDIYANLESIRKDLGNIGLYNYFDLILEDIVGCDAPLLGFDDDEDRFRTAEILKHIGYKVETVVESDRILEVVR